MDTIDIVLIILILFGIIIGYKRGFIVEVVSTLSLFISIALAFLLKNNVSILMYENLPFFSFDGIFKGITVVNILIYEIIAFLLVLLLSLILVKVLKIILKLIEGIIKEIKILSIPSKILGAITGGIKWLLLAFLISYVMVSLNYNYTNNSKICNYLLKNTFLFSHVIDNSLEVYKEFYNLKEQHKQIKDKDEFNKKALQLFLKRGVITYDSVKVLYEKEKLNFEGIEKILNLYKEEQWN